MSQSEGQDSQAQTVATRKRIFPLQLLFALSCVWLWFFLFIAFVAFEYNKAKNFVSKHPLYKCGYQLTEGSIPISLVSGIMAQEDHMFFRHKGFNWEEVRESFFKNLEAAKIVRGASTIDMQVASICYPYFKKKSRWVQKFKEILFTMIINKKYSKREILRAYLTAAPLMLEVKNSGFERAAQFYYEKPLRELNLDELWGLILTLRSKRNLNPNILRAGRGKQKLAQISLQAAMPRQKIIEDYNRKLILKTLPYIYDDHRIYNVTDEKFVDLNVQNGDEIDLDDIDEEENVEQTDEETESKTNVEFEVESAKDYEKNITLDEDEELDSDKLKKVNADNSSHTKNSSANDGASINPDGDEKN